MVLQQGMSVPVWGWADPGEQVTVTIAGQKQSATAGADRKWMLRLTNLRASSDPIEMTIAGKNTIKIVDILVGEVWLGSGQSNMDFVVSGDTAKYPGMAQRFAGIANEAEEIAAANCPKIGEFRVPLKTSEVPLEDVAGKWYQGESITEGLQLYPVVMEHVITSWRQQWGEGEFPFYFVQLAAEDANSNRPEVREAQAQALKLPNTAMAVAMDIGEKTNVHPKNKQELCDRLARIARANVYGEKIEYYGPMYDSMRVEGQSVRVRFTHVGGGLVAKGGDLKWFQLAGAAVPLRRLGVRGAASCCGRWPYVAPAILSPVCYRGRITGDKIAGATNSLSPGWRGSAGLTAATSTAPATWAAGTLSWGECSDGNVDERLLGTLVKQAVLVAPGCAARIECVALPGLHDPVPQDDPRSIRAAVPGRCRGYRGHPQVHDLMVSAGVHHVDGAGIALHQPHIPDH
jgi:hypothetical protein